jgi:hypothetical protein
MWRVQPKKRRYLGPIFFEEQPITWIKKHRGIADKPWFESQVRFGEWKKDRNDPSCFLIYATEFEGRKSVTIQIRIKKLFTHVLVCHAHVSGKKE